MKKIDLNFQSSLHNNGNISFVPASKYSVSDYGLLNPKRSTILLEFYLKFPCLCIDSLTRRLQIIFWAITLVKTGKEKLISLKLVPTGHSNFGGSFVRSYVNEELTKNSIFRFVCILQTWRKYSGLYEPTNIQTKEGCIMKSQHEFHFSLFVRCKFPSFCTFTHSRSYGTVYFRISFIRLHIYTIHFG